ncbi:TOMM precursor leader peptide-binding protein [Actinokineospora soli]|uniref:TOMM leader peptide-binding protein n=1 Tax=Actinokineospora soli TaxID=1048753 RepID=A0ABW2TLH3_9PSEU
MTATTTQADVVGSGFLARHLAERLRAEGVDTGALAAAGIGAVLTAELNRLADYHDTIIECLGTGSSLLFVGTWRSLVYVGPMWTPGAVGCPHCLVNRTANSAFGPDLHGDQLAESSTRDLERFTLGPRTLGVVVRLVRERVEAAARGEDVADGSVWVVDGATGTAERQFLLPDSTCPSCAVPGSDTTPVFTEPDVPLTKLAPGVLRTAEMDADVVERDYLFAGLGLFKEVRVDLQSPTGACSVELSSRWGRREPAIGRARTYRSSRTIAVLEGLERYAGLYRGGRAAPVRASWAELADRAIDPRELGVHPDSSYDAEGFRYRRFHPDTVVDWVWAYSFVRRDRVLIPERSAFWGPRHDGEISFAYDTSNGCALGNSIEEAVLHGLREIAERDSFLMAWYRKLALPEVPLDDVGGDLGRLLRKAALFTGFRFRAFLSTMEYGLPSFWLTAEGGEPDGPAVLAGAGAHPDPVQAIAGGMHELIGSVLAMKHDYAGKRSRGLEMFADPDLMTRMEDHSLVGALPEARPRYDFLLDSAHQRIDLADVPGQVQHTEPDLRADLDVVVSGFLGAGLDVLVVDQTMPELRRNGLHCVRVLVPGTLPITFGHRNRRTENLPRLVSGAGLAYPSLLEPGEEIGCVPHPFP